MVAYERVVHAPDGTIVDRGAVAAFRCGPIDGAIFDPPPPR